MGKIYNEAIEEQCSKGILVLDWFYIARTPLTKRWMRFVKREASSIERKALKGLRWLLYKRSSNRSKQDSRLLNAVKKVNKDEFEQFWWYKTPLHTKRFFMRRTIPAENTPSTYYQHMLFSLTIFRLYLLKAAKYKCKIVFSDLIDSSPLGNRCWHMLPARGLLLKPSVHLKDFMDKMIIYAQLFFKYFVPPANMKK